MALNRRQFIIQSLTASGMLILPGCGDRDPANDRINMALIGCGRKGRPNISNLMGVAGEFNAQVSAVCDLDGKRAAETAQFIEDLYRESGYSHSVRTYRDYRELLDNRSIDLVVVATPDHWHSRIAIEAALAGKDLYLEKPITFTIAEGNELVRAVRQKGVVFQAGTQQRSSVYFRRVCELVRNGKVGELREIEVFLPRDSGYGNPEPMPVPEKFDYRQWLGEVPFKPYTVDRCHPQDGYGRPGWMQIEDTCHGMITNWGSHMLDIAQWGKGSEDSGPVRIKADAVYEDRGLWDVHTAIMAENEYADGVRLLLRSISPEDEMQPGVRFIGSEGWAACERGAFDASDRSLLRWEAGPDDIRLHPSSNHHRDFLYAVRNRTEPAAPVEVAHRSNSLCLLNMIAAKLGRELEWNPEAQRFVNDEAANRMITDMGSA